MRQGVPPRVVMEILGHSQISVTANTYTQMSTELQRDAMGRIHDLIGGPVVVDGVVVEESGPPDQASSDE